MTTYTPRSITMLLAMASLGASLPSSAASATYRGHYFYNFEMSILTPQGSRELWCVEGGMAKAIERRTHGKGPLGPSDVQVRGVLGPEGHYGSLGVCSRVLTVTRLIALRPIKLEH